MRKLLRLPIVFFFVASVIGLLLRWHQYDPIPGFTYSFWLHGHSHIMFLGWVFNALSMAFVISFLPEKSFTWYRRILIVINILLVGMLISFPLQGYGKVSIIISTLHTVLVVVFTLRFFRDTKDKKSSQSAGFARLSLLFFIISSAGPFALGTLVANGLATSVWYNLAVYYYLHFQYNGVFVFGVFSLFYNLLEEKGIDTNQSLVKSFRTLLFIATIPAYALSSLWTQSGLIFNGIGLAAALIQLWALVLFIMSIREHFHQFLARFSPTSRALMIVAGLALIVKLVLQLLSAFPAIASLAYDVRFYVIAYLHLVLIGMVSFFLLAWYHEKHYAFVRSYNLIVLLVGFIASEIAMISVGLIPESMIRPLLVGASFLLIIGLGGVGLDSFRTGKSML